MDAEQFLLLQRYRRDRRKLLEFILVSDLIKAPSGGPVDVSGADLDRLDVDYLLECVHSGEAFDLEEAAKKFHEGRKFPIMMTSSATNSFFLLSKLEISGSPPQQVAPRIVPNSALNFVELSSKQASGFLDSEIDSFGTETDMGDQASTSSSRHHLKDGNTLPLGLPTLSTGLADDDLRETAYEVLIASVILSGVQMDTYEEKKKPKRVPTSRLKRESSSLPQKEDDYLELLNTIRIQMEISEATDARVKKGLKRFSSNMLNERIDVPQISLELLSFISKLDFPSEKSFLNWHRRQVNIIEEQLYGSAMFLDDDNEKLRFLFGKLKNKENVGPSGYVETLAALRHFALSLSKIPGTFRIPSETYYWTACYHLNVRLYEKLLFSIFDVLEDGRVIEEMEEVLIVYRLTWRILGITGRMHSALYGWVLFQQFVQTGKPVLLKYAALEIQKVLVDDGNDGRTNAYISCLTCSIGGDPSKKDLSLVDAVLFNISTWCCSQLEDYHLNFAEDTLTNFERITNLAILLASYFSERYVNTTGNKLENGSIVASSELLHGCVERSVRAAYKRVVDLLDEKCSIERKEPLVVLANELMLIAKEGSTLFIPVLCQHYFDAGIHSSVLLHQLYGGKLRPFLEDITYLSESVISVLSGAYDLETFLASKIKSACKNGSKSPFLDYLTTFEIREICSPLILQWVNAQHDGILEWTKRAIQLEDWEPLSSQRRQSASIVEVFRIIEETVDQFFNFNLPMDSFHLRSLLIGISRSLDAYLIHMAGQLVDKKIMYPAAAALTRYEDSLVPFMKRKFGENVAVEEKASNQLDSLTLSKICIRLNTAYYIRDQLDTLEESIQKSWMLVQKADYLHGQASNNNGVVPDELVDELFTIFDDIRRTAIGTTDALIDIIGTRVVFWDLRDSFLASLYHGNVENARLEKFLPQLDAVLDELCDLILDILRDRVVSNICHAAMEGFVFVMINGGPSRAFSEDDVAMLQEDLNILKDFFVADGHGLPSVVVETEARLAQEIINLYGLKPDTIIQMLKSASGEASLISNDEKPIASRDSTDAYTLLRVLCHKKDKFASRYLKLYYNLPKSSDYIESTGKESLGKSPLIPDLFKTSNGVRENTSGKQPLLPDFFKNVLAQEPATERKSPFLPDMFKKNISAQDPPATTGKSPLLADIFKNNTWTETGSRSFRKMTQKIYDATSEMKYTPW